MSQIVQDVVLSPDGEQPQGTARRTTRFALLYSSATVGILLFLSAFPDSHIGLLRSDLFPFLWRTSIPVVAACVAIVFYLLVFAPRGFLPALLILAIAHGAIVAIVFWLMSRENPAQEIESFFRLAVVFWLAIAALSTALAYWNRRRCLRIQHVTSKEPTSPQRTLPPVTTLDCVYLAFVLVAMGLFQKWAQGPMAEALPMGVIVVGTLAVIARLALSPGGRGFSPVAVMVTGLTCLLIGWLFVWYLFPPESVVLLVLIVIPAVIWSGVLLSLRGDGYRFVRDFSAMNEPDPLAESDPFA